jgi:hypothetical protein
MKINQMGGVLLSYAHPRPNQLFPNILEDFSDLAKTAPAEIIAEGLSAALQSDETASFGHLVADLFLRSDAEQRAGLLNILVEHISESSCGALANAGLFGLTSYASQISSARTMDISPEAVLVMAMEAERRDAAVVYRFSLGRFQPSTDLLSEIALVENGGLANMVHTSIHYPRTARHLLEDLHGRSTATF